MYPLTALVLLTLVSIIVAQYIPPQPKVEPLYPKGFRISIPDEQGISLVAYHLKFNEEFDGLEAGTIARDVVVVRKGRWYYGNRDIQLKYGDVIHYWVHVVYNGLGYNLLNQQHLVTDFYDLQGSKVSIDNNNSDRNNEKIKDCVLSSTKIRNFANGKYEDTCEGELLLHEEFESLNETIWRRLEQFSTAPDYPFVVYRKKELNVKVRSGKLLLIPKLLETEYGRSFVRRGNLTLDKCTAEIGTINCQRQARGSYILPPISSGCVDTKNSFVFLYGTIEIRAKLPKGDWLYPVMSLEAFDNNEVGNSYPQLRVAASSGNAVLRSSGGTDLSGHVLSGGGNRRNFESPIGSTAMPKRFANNFWSDEYHIYRLEWTKFRIAVKVDGVEYGSTKPGAPFDKPFYIKLAVDAGGHTEFPDMCEADGYVKPWRNIGAKAVFDFFKATDLWARTWENNAKDLTIDYVKVWAV